MHSQQNIKIRKISAAWLLVRAVWSILVDQYRHDNVSVLKASSPNFDFKFIIPHPPTSLCAF